jgi:hypothetical protein
VAIEGIAKYINDEMEKLIQITRSFVKSALYGSAKQDFINM